MYIFKWCTYLMSTYLIMYTLFFLFYQLRGNSCKSRQAAWGQSRASKQEADWETSGGDCISESQIWSLESVQSPPKCKQNCKSLQNLFRFHSLKEQSVSLKSRLVFHCEWFYWSVLPHLIKSIRQQRFKTALVPSQFHVLRKKDGLTLRLQGHN